MSGTCSPLFTICGGASHRRAHIGDRNTERERASENEHHRVKIFSPYRLPKDSVLRVSACMPLSLFPVSLSLTQRHHKPVCARRCFATQSTSSSPAPQRLAHRHAGTQTRTHAPSSNEEVSDDKHHHKESPRREEEGEAGATYRYRVREIHTSINILKSIYNTPTSAPHTPSWTRATATKRGFHFTTLVSW